MQEDSVLCEQLCFPGGVLTRMREEKMKGSRQAGTHVITVFLPDYSTVLSHTDPHSALPQLWTTDVVLLVPA